MKEVLNESLRRALTGGGTGPTKYTVTPHVAELQPGIDPAGFNRLATDLEDDEILRRMSGDGS